MEFQVLGPVRIVRADGTVVSLGTLQRKLLAVLLSGPDTGVSTEALFDALWPGEPYTPGSSRLQVHVTRLRRVLDDPARLRFEHGAYRLATHDDEVDAVGFEALLDRARDEPDPARRATTIRRALSLWYGEAYDGVDAVGVLGEAWRLAERRESARELLYDAELRAGRHTEITGELTEAVARHPLRERLCGQLMTALHRCGRQADALAVFRRTRRRLVDELGLEPGPELRAVEQRILAGADLDAEQARRPVPRQLPHVVADFVGRDVELSELDTAAGAGPLVVVSGAGGVGKTALVVHWARLAADRFPDGQLHVDLRGYGPDEPLRANEALGTVLHQLGVPSHQLPPDTDGRAMRLRSECAGRALLVVLDNARTVEQVRPLLPGTPTCAVVVTSRDALTGLVVRDGARRLELGPLSGRDSSALVGRLLRTRADTDRATIDVLVEQCARLPLALRIVTELANSRPATRLADLVAELSDEHGRLDVLHVDGDAHSSVRAVFSWSYRGLPAPAARLFRLTGLHPGADTDTVALAALAGTDLHATRSAVDLLVSAYLLERSPEGRLRAHDLLRAYAAELVTTEETAAGRDAATRRLEAHYLDAAATAVAQVEPQEVMRRPVPPPADPPRPALDTPRAARAWLAAERATLVAVALGAGRPAVTVDLALVLARYLQNAHLDDSLALCQAALRAVTGGDRLAYAHITRVLAATYSRLGRVEESLASGQRAHTLYLDLGEPLFAALPLITISSTHTQLGQHRAALAAARTCVELVSGLDDVPTVLHAHIQARIGDVLAHLGRHDEARRHLTTALALATEVDNPYLQSIVHLMLGQTDHWSGDDHAARTHLERSRAMVVELGSRIGEAQLHVLATVYWRLGMRAEAFAWAWRCAAIAREAGFRLKAADPLLVLGELHRLNGAHADAVEHYEQALVIAENLGHRHQRALALAGLADTQAAMARQPAQS
ncbi:hypothetical protein BLA60_05410 [Actinophytocola xinjiangensis]|uniref:OmpR/PhoB-type domain-containing protein n=1 Tax=Actinophytocola xinjiangensis TaxID=485602 RepID=A0A7Z0WR10_9PSEU|nr:BTAD domain-containing putative transcriptional regulator [Actinophytocola xinjiangensis]OLF12717.1 hypothetical protein BLA60_05410 [Actinophytocola xinjiangensis]